MSKPEAKRPLPLNRSAQPERFDRSAQPKRFDRSAQPNRPASGVISAGHIRERGIMAFQPRRLDLPMSRAATDFIANDLGRGGDFHINPVVAQQTGIASVREQDIEASMELRLLEKLKVVEEEAYKKGFDQGLREGTEKANAEILARGRQQLESLDQLNQRIESLTPKLISHNEAQIVDLIFYVARTIAFRDIKLNADAIKDVLKEVGLSLQNDDNVTFRISPDDLKTLEMLRQSKDHQFEYLEKARLLADEAITRGGCMIETNFGMINATLEMRVEKIWNMLQEKKPQIKDTIE